MKPEKQARHERKIFRAFAADAGLNVAPKSIRSVKQPRPDIMCQTDDGLPLAFEFGLVVDEGMARDFSDSISMNALFRKAYDTLPRNQRTRLRRRLHNAVVFVWFVDGASLRAREAVIPQVISVLEQIEMKTGGELPLADRSNLRSTVTRLSITRGQFVGPVFDVSAGDSFGDPVVDLVRKKFSKSYRAAAPFDLLAFYELQGVSPDFLWLPQLKDFVARNLGRSPFRRVWVYDAIERKVRYVHPPLGSEGAY